MASISSLSTTIFRSAGRFTRYLRMHGVEVNTTMHFDNIQTIKEAVILGSGVSIIPARILQAELADGRLSAVPLSEPGLYATARNRTSEEEAFSSRRTGFPRSFQEAPAKPANVPVLSIN